MTDSEVTSPITVEAVINSEEVLQAFRTYLASNPAVYFDGMDSIVEFLYIQFTETNPVECKEVKESYIAFMDELVKLIGFRAWSMSRLRCMRKRHTQRD